MPQTDDQVEKKRKCVPKCSTVTCVECPKQPFTSPFAGVAGTCGTSACGTGCGGFSSALSGCLTGGCSPSPCSGKNKNKIEQPKQTAFPNPALNSGIIRFLQTLCPGTCVILVPKNAPVLPFSFTTAVAVPAPTPITGFDGSFKNAIIGTFCAFECGAIRLTNVLEIGTALELFALGVLGGIATTTATGMTCISPTIIANALRGIIIPTFVQDASDISSIGVLPASVTTTTGSACAVLSGIAATPTTSPFIAPLATILETLLGIPACV